MSYVRTLLLVLLVFHALVFAFFWGRSLLAAPRAGWPSVWEIAIGFVTDFLDTLGIGSFATTATLFRVRGSVQDRALPGTMNVGHALPTVLQAVIYIGAIEIDVVTLIALIAAAMLGAYLGAGWVARWSERTVRLVVGCALIAAALLMFAQMQGFLPGGGSALGLHGVTLAVAVLGNLLLGALMTMGIGLYAPCMLMVSLLGADPKAAFPIMMGSCAFLMLIAAPRFVSTRSYSARPALGLALGGLPAVWIAATIVRELALNQVRWLVLIVVLYTAFSLLRAARRSAV